MVELLAQERLGRLPRRLGLRLGRSDELLDDARQRTPIRFRSGRQVAHEFGVEGAGLTAAGVKTPIRVQVGRRHHELLLKCHGTHQVQKEGLASAVLTDDDTEC
ncbi:hypothetical protein SDC9_155818 [bioreactor metagenome]|uniref:Uncharacterized protein n=1 Tax=bioreactor metagenome TaxID=1076179 RepID=A0A645F2I6_9ZZZZ